MIFLLKLALTNFKWWFPLEGKTSKQKKNGFDQPENPFPLVGMKDFIEKDASTRRSLERVFQKESFKKTLSEITGNSLWKNGEKNDFH